MRPSLETIIERLAATNRLLRFSIVRSEDRYQANIQRAGRNSFKVSVKPTALEAIFDVLGPDAYQTWEEHLRLDEDEDDGSNLI